jgi:hypothetical protein
MNYIRSIIIGFSACLLTLPADACSCVFSKSSFVRLAKRSEIVFRGKVIEYYWDKRDTKHKRAPLAMAVEVKEVYRGATKSGKLTVWGDNGMQCRPYVTQFPIETEWVFALSKDRFSENRELAVSGCGAYWLQVKGSNVVGKVRNDRFNAKPEAIGLPDFRKLLRAAI